MPTWQVHMYCIHLPYRLFLHFHPPAFRCRIFRSSIFFPALFLVPHFAVLHFQSPQMEMGIFDNPEVADAQVHHAMQCNLPLLDTKDVNLFELKWSAYGHPCCKLHYIVQWNMRTTDSASSMILLFCEQLPVNLHSSKFSCRSGNCF